MSHLKHKLFILIFLAGIVVFSFGKTLAAPSYNLFRNIAPATTTSPIYNIGSSTARWLNLYTEYASTTAISLSTGAATTTLTAGATSTFATGVLVNNGGLRVSTLTSASCDLKATTLGVLYCGTDATGGITIGNAVTGGTANRILYEDASNLIAESANLVFNGTNFGLGTTTPSQLLSVQGNALISGTTTLETLRVASSTSYFNGMGLYQPVGESMKYPKEIIITSFQAGHGWTKTYTGGTFTENDTADFIVGTQSAKMSAPANTVTNMRITSQTPIDLRDKYVRLFIKFDDASGTMGSSIYVSNNNLTDYISCNIENIIDRSDTNNVWMPITFSLSNTTTGCQTTGNPDFSAINSFQITASSTVAINVNVNKLSYFDKPNKGVISLTFDDGWATQYTNAKVAMATSSFPATAYVFKNAIDTASYMTLAQLKEFQDVHGWDIACHTANHVNLTTVSTSTAEAQILECKNWLLKNGFQKGADHFAYPNGAYNEHTVLPLIRKYFKSARTIEEYPETLPPYDPYRLRVYNITDTDATTTLQTAIKSAATNKEWLILLFHGIGDDPATQNNTSKLKFQTILNEIIANNLNVKTISEVLNETNPNLLELQNGKISIGTTTPYSKLSIWGSGTTTGQLLEMTNFASTTLMKVRDDGLSYFSGNFGIGTTTPSQLLSVHGNALISGTTTVQGLIATNTLMVGGNSGTNFIVKSNGFVGIGVTNPGIELDVTGSVRASSYFRSNVGLTNNTSIANSNFQTLVAGALSTRNVADANPVLIVQNLNAGSTGDILQLKNDVSILGVLTQTGNLGIGTTTPSQLLSVQGNALISGTTTVKDLIATGSLAVKGTATSTFAGGISTDSGYCFSDGTCLNKPPKEPESIIAFSFRTASSSMSTTTALFSFQPAIDITLKELSCFTNQGTSTINADERASTTPNTAGTNVLAASALRCGAGTKAGTKSGAYASTTFDNKVISAFGWLNFQITDASPTGLKPTEITISGKYIK